MKKVGLIVEGGGFRGIYTAGLLDFFLEKEWYFPYVSGVSMGACNAANYISRQKGRSIDIPQKFMDDHRYISMRNLVKDGNMFGMEFIFKDIPYKYLPFDFDTFNGSKQDFVIVTTDCLFGGPKYFHKSDLTEEEALTALCASSSLPYISKMVDLKGMKLLDGGLTDSIPVEQGFLDGMDKLIILMTRPRGYRKEAPKTTRVNTLAYRGYPEVAKAMNERYIGYNKTLEAIEAYEKEGKVLPIYPKEPINIGRTEKDKEKLKKVYRRGYKRAVEMEETLVEFLADTNLYSWDQPLLTTEK